MEEGEILEDAEQLLWDSIPIGMKRGRNKNTHSPTSEPVAVASSQHALSTEEPLPPTQVPPPLPPSSPTNSTDALHIFGPSLKKRKILTSCKSVNADVVAVGQTPASSALSQPFGPSSSTVETAPTAPGVLVDQTPITPPFAANGDTTVIVPAGAGSARYAKNQRKTRKQREKRVIKRREEKTEQRNVGRMWAYGDLHSMMLADGDIDATPETKPLDIGELVGPLEVVSDTGASSGVDVDGDTTSVVEDLPASNEAVLGMEPSGTQTDIRVGSPSATRSGPTVLPSPTLVLTSMDVTPSTALTPTHEPDTTLDMPPPVVATYTSPTGQDASTRCLSASPQHSQPIFAVLPSVSPFEDTDSVAALTDCSNNHSSDNITITLGPTLSTPDTSPLASTLPPSAPFFPYACPCRIARVPAVTPSFKLHHRIGVLTKEKSAMQKELDDQKDKIRQLEQELAATKNARL